MKYFISNRWGWITIVLGALMGLMSIGLVSVDQAMTWRWVAFGLHLAGVAMIVVASMVKGGVRDRESKTRARSKTHIFLFLFVIAYTVLVNTIFLTTYPFVAEGDEVRDSGIEAMEIAIGIRKNIFGWGAYDSHGLIIPTLTSFLYRLIPGSLLVWRLPAMVAGSLGVLLVFLFLINRVTHITAFWASFVLANLPLHLYYSRTQLVVMFGSTLMMFLLMAFTNFARRRDLNALMLFVVSAGFFSTFYTSIRTVAVFLAGLAAMLIIARVLDKQRGWIGRLLYAGGALLSLVLFFLIGFGPRLLYTPKYIFFQQSRVLPFKSLTHVTYASLREDLFTILLRYQESLLVFGIKPTMSWYPDHRPILPGFLYPFFLVGILVALTKHRSSMWPVLVLAAVIPLTNSAITEGVNFDHRLAPLFPISAILTGIGITWFLKDIRQAKWLWVVSTLTIAGSIVWMGASFFVNQPANKEKTIRQYVSMHLVRFLSERKGSLGSRRYCLYVNPEFVEYFNFMHIREQYAYFVPRFSYETRLNPSLRLGKNEVYLSRSCTETAPRMLLSKISCSNRRTMKSFFCPAHGEQYTDILIWGEQGMFH